MANADFVTRITLQNQEFQNEIQRCKNEIRQLKKEGESSNSAISSLTSGFSKLGLVKFGIAGGIAAATDTMLDFAKSSLDAYRNIEMLKTSFTTLLGSASQADQLVSSLREYGAQSPYDTEGLSKAAQLMLGYGMNLQRVMPTLKQLGDIAMGDNNKLQSLALAFSQMSAAGKVCKQDLNQMINAGFNPLQTISEKTGESIGLLTEKVSKGEISVQQIEQAFKDATSAGGKFYNMSNNMSDTLDGQLASLNDEWQEMKANMGEIIAPAVKSGLAYLTGVVSDLSDALKAVKRAIDAIESTKHNGGMNNDQKDAYQQKTDNAIKWARTYGKGENGNKSIANAISLEEKFQKRDQGKLRNLQRKADQLNAKNKKGQLSNKKGKNGKTEFTELIEAEAEIRNLQDLMAQREGRIASYKSELPSTSKKPISPSTTKGGGRVSAKGGGRVSAKEVIPKGSLADLENQLSSAQKAASNAVGKIAYQQAMATVKEIQNKIDSFKWTDAPKSKDISEIVPSNSNNDYSIGLPNAEGLNVLQETLNNINTDRINELTKALEDAKSTFNSFGGSTVSMQRQLTDIVKAFKTTRDASSTAGAGIALLGQTMSSFDGEAAKVGAIMAAIGQLVLGYATATAQAAQMGPWAWIAFAITGLATLATTISQVTSFSQGGIINGGSVAGDQMIARVNAGEMILNGSQQKKLFNSLNSNGAIGGASMGGQVEFKINGSVLKGVLRNYDKKTSIL